MHFKLFFSRFEFLFALLLFNFPFISTAQVFNSESGSEVEANVAYPEDPFGRNTPRGTVKGFISAIAEEDYDKASQYLNLENLSDTAKSGEALAKDLQTAFDKGGLYALTRISNDSLGRTDDELPSEVDKVGEIETRSDTFEILVEMTEGAEGGPIWLFSWETINKVESINIQRESLLIDRILPVTLKEKGWRGVPVGQWIAVVVLVLIAYFLSWGITALLGWIIRAVWKKSSINPTAGVLLALTLPLRLYLAVLIYVILFQKLGLSIVLREKFSIITLTVGVVALFLLLWRLTDFIGDYSNKRLKEQGNSSGMSIVLFLQRLFKILIVVIGFIVILSAFGVNVTAGLAALGIGGIALALGAQKTMENFVGSVTLITDQPVRVGDACKVGNVEGTVESIGMRSTRIRTDSRSVVTIPNGQFSADQIENFSQRDIFLFNPVLELRYETTPEQIRFLLVEIRTMLYSHPKLTIDPARVRFTNLSTSSVTLKIFTYINAKNNNEFLEVQEDLLLRIMDIVKASGTDFAFPSQTLYLAKDEGVSKEKTLASEEKVKQWREEDDLQVPHYDAHRIQKIKNSIQYPPEGSYDKEKDKFK